MNQSSTSKNKWFFAEVIVISSMLIYFFCYPRDTLVYFIVLTLASLLLVYSKDHLNLPAPAVRPISKMDRGLGIMAVLLFLIAWFYAWSTNKITTNTALTSLVITSVYFYYALIQHYLAQRYLALRMWRIQQKWETPGSVELRGALTTGFIFGFIHIPYPHLIIVSMCGGFLFAYYYLNTGRLWAVVVAHALIASPSLYWYLDDNPFTELQDFIFG